MGHWPGSPVVPSEAVPACHPCYPGGPQITRQRRWSPKHRSSSPDNGVDALTEFTRLPLGSLHATACEVAHVRRTRSSGTSVPWVTPHTSLELPGRAARSRGRTSTGEFQSIHSILSGTFRWEFAKACKRAGVPVPPSGYWARVQNGQRPRRIPLPKVERGYPVTITVHGSPTT